MVTQITRNKSMDIKAALWAVIPDNEYRTEMLVQLVALANSSSLSIDISEIPEMRKGMKALRNADDRSHSPRFQKQAPHNLALQGPGPRSKWEGKGNTRNRKGPKGSCRDTDKGSANRVIGNLTFATILDTSRMLFHQKGTHVKICSAFQIQECNDSSCARKQCCVGCATLGKPHDHCFCLPGKVRV